jgi:hypothetical protein
MDFIYHLGIQAKYMSDGLCLLSMSPVCCLKGFNLNGVDKLYEEMEGGNRPAARVKK